MREGKLEIDPIDRNALIEALKVQKQKIAASPRMKKKGKWWECYKAVDPLIRVIQRQPSVSHQLSESRGILPGWKVNNCPDLIEKCHRQWPQYSFEAHVNGDIHHTCTLDAGHGIPCVCARAHIAVSA